MTKMIDVAKLANVSTATVSRVLAGKENITEETKRKVLEAVALLEYKTNRIASNLRKRSSKTVAVILPNITYPFFSQIVQGIKEVVSANDYHLLLADTGNDKKAEIDFLELVKEKLVDGVILATARIEKEKIFSISNEIPLVLACEYIEGYDIPTVAIDNVSAAREAVEHLILLGHRRIGTITGPLGVILSRDRLKGYRQALDMNEIANDESLIQEGDFSIESGYNIMNKFLSMDRPPTAIFAACDEMAVGALKAIKKKGLRVPDDISIVGFDDITLCNIVEPELTTISQPKREMGYQSMQLLLDIMGSKTLTRKQIVLPHKLIVRESTSHPSRIDSCQVGEAKMLNLTHY